MTAIKSRCCRKSLAIVLLWVASTLGVAATPEPERPELRVLFVGNSLVYANNLPGLLRALAAAQPSGPRIVTADHSSWQHPAFVRDAAFAGGNISRWRPSRHH